MSRKDAQQTPSMGKRIESEGPGFVIRDGVVIAPEWAEGLREEDVNTPEKLRAARAERNAPPDE